LTAGVTLIDEGKYQVACVVVRSSLVPKALQRWPNARVISGVFEETPIFANYSKGIG